MAKKFTKLFLGDVVKTIGSKSYRKLTTEQPVVQDELQGTWVFNDTVDNRSYPNGLMVFTSNGIEYKTLTVWKDSEAPRTPPIYYVDTTDVYTTVYNGTTGWVDSAYKTITITTKPTDEEFIAWLKANATKQSASTPTLISFTIGGTKYQAEEGMEWASWVGSAYNTHGYFMEGIAIYDSDYTRIYYQPYTSANITIYGSDIILANGTYGTFQSMSGGSN